MLGDKEWTVELRLAYCVKAASPDQALGAVLPLLSLSRDRYGLNPVFAATVPRQSPYCTSASKVPMIVIASSL